MCNHVVLHILEISLPRLDVYFEDFALKS